MHDKASATTHFGFRDVPVDEKSSLVRGVFDRVVPRYDLMNDLMSAGLHRLWKDALADALSPRPGMHVLDVAGGTGDIAFRILRRAAQARVTVCDVNPGMTGSGRDRAIDHNLLHGIDWMCGDAERLPLPDRSVDACTIAFGLRNVTHTQVALGEMHRVLKHGGHFLCLEFAQVPHDWLRPIYDWYSFEVIPRIGRAVTGDDAPYRYLVESIRRFPAPERLTEMMRAAGFAQVSWRTMTMGVVALHSGWRT